MGVILKNSEDLVASSTILGKVLSWPIKKVWWSSFDDVRECTLSM